MDSRALLAARVAEIAPFHVMEVQTAARALEAAGRSVVHMEIGEPDFPTPAPVVAAAQRAIADGKVYYTSALGLPALREAIAHHYADHYGVDVAPERVIVTAGSSAALLLVLALLVNRDDRILMSDPGYPCNRHFVRVLEGDPVGIPVGPETNYQLTAALIEGAWTPATRGALIASPSNPTGTSVPADAQAIVVEGVRRTIDWQDVAHARLYLDRLDCVRAAAPGAPPRLLAETARHLALWMTYEDTIRVAALKTRATRFERVHGEVRVAAGQVLAIDEYLHPRLQEICETLPTGLARWLERPGWPRRLVERWTEKGKVVTTSSLSGFLLLYAIAGLRRFRRQSVRFVVEGERIDAWLAEIARVAAIDPALAVEVAQCQRLVKGYGDTHARGWRNFGVLMGVVGRAGAGLAPATLAELRDAALADEQGLGLAAALRRHALA